MSAQSQSRITPEEYLALERNAETRSEYFGGEMFAMAGGSPEHGLVINNIGGELRALLRERPCLVFNSDVRLRVDATGLYCYPDVMVVCGPPCFADDQRDTVLNPVVIIEVTSPTTEDYDRGGKFAHFRTIDSVCDYLVVAQDRPHAELYHRAPDGRRWIFSETEGLDSAVVLESIKVSLELREIYHKLEELSASRSLAG